MVSGCGAEQSKKDGSAPENWGAEKAENRSKGHPYASINDLPIHADIPKAQASVLTGDA